MLNIINKKRLGQILTKEEINYVVEKYVSGEIPDYQMSALLMAICINDMTDEETFNLTDAMINSGETLDLSGIQGSIVDKHSTGGVGDKTTLILAPIVASCGVNVCKMSGRGLGHTGGTIDKLESINGFNVNLSIEDAIKEVNKVGAVIVSQTGNLVPADKKIYALRDVSGTVESIPLIASSIMSKKIASGASSIVIDLKVGNGALIKNLEDAKHLSDLMIKIGKKYNRKVVCVLTNMDKPLGTSIGNALEVKEALEFLNGNRNKDLEEIIYKLASLMVSLGKNVSEEIALKEVKEKLNNKEALSKFYEIVKNQGGNIDDLKISNRVFSIKSPYTGFVKEIDTLKLGELSRSIGAGRYKKDDVIDYTVGFVLNKNVGDYVLKDEELVKVYLNKIDLSINDITSCFKIDSELGDVLPNIYGVIK
ncbi:MAG: thymidine phosphorylase [Firmicutes bacterium]|nr:thymidine phosphorylase [Bacillota bacterium]